MVVLIQVNGSQRYAISIKIKVGFCSSLFLSDTSPFTPKPDIEQISLMIIHTCRHIFYCFYIPSMFIVFSHFITRSIYLILFSQFFSSFGIEQRKVLRHQLLLKVYDDDANQIFNFLIHNLDVTKRRHICKFIQALIIVTAAGKST